MSQAAPQEHDQAQERDRVRETVRARAGEGGRWSIALWAAVLAGFVVRALFLADKPLWRDEAWVAMLVSDPLAAGAAGRAAPVGFLALTQLVVSMVPWSPEVAYRLVPLAAGVAAIPAVARWAVSLGASRAAAVVAAWLAAGVPPLVYYSRELKSYDLDLLLAILAPMLAASAYARGGTSARRASFAAVAVATPWLSFGGIFAVGAAFAWGWLARWRELDLAARRWWIGTTVAFLVSFGFVYAIALGAQSGDEWMQRYWSFHLAADRRLWLPAKLALALWQVVSVSVRYLFPESWPVAVALALVGAASWPRRGRVELAFLYLATIGACATAAVLDRYLLAQGRLLLFTMPIPLLWIAQGLVTVAERVAGCSGRGVAVAAAAAMSLWWSGEAIRWRVGDVRTRQALFFRYDVLQDVDLAIEAAARVVPRGERLLVSRRASYPFQFYYDGEPIHAAFCVRDCRDGDRLARKWLERVDRRAWVLLLDEEVRAMRRVVADAGLVPRQRVAVRGVRIWEVRRPGPLKAPRPASAPPKRPARPARP